MIRGIGIDIVSLQQVKRAMTPHFLERILSKEEQALLPPEPRAAEWVAGRWAAKEAVSKALGCGFRECLPWDVEILYDTQGAPLAVLSGKALDRLHFLGGQRVWVSISHNEDYAVAQAVAE